MRTRFFSQPCPTASCARSRASTAGFTLVELMVALTGGLFLSIVVFALSRDASRFYQRESRVANATLSGLSGFERLSNDVARAGHLATPNIQADPRVCNLPQANWPAVLRRLRAIVIEPTNTAQLTGTEVTAASNTAQKPQGIVIAGALNTTEVLYTAQVGTAATGGWQVFINLDTPSAARVGLSPLTTATAANLAVMTSIFMSGTTGRIIRLRWNGRDQYAVAAGVSTNPGQAVVSLATAPALQKLTAGGGQCGVDSLGTGMSLSIIDLVRYDIRRMVNDANYAALYKASGLSAGGGPSTAPFENGRAELVRVELTPDGQEIDATREIVGEYAVDLQFGAWGATSSVNPALVAVNNAINETYTGTQLLRGLHVRLAMRSREADREAPIATGSGGGPTDIYRFPLADAAGNLSYARVRTFQSDVPLRNMENANW
jgi:hypothetical protein